MQQSKTLTVSAIENGTVIDHVTSGQAFVVLKALKWIVDDKKASVAMNLSSKSMGIKDLLKLEDRYLSEKDLEQLAIIAPNATINLIRNYEVVKKFQVELPKEIIGIIPCSNGQCISNHEAMLSRMDVRKHGPLIQLRCRYCRERRSYPDGDKR